MAKQRYINTKFWDDPYITNLDPSEKLIFLYCLTNPCTNISGAYEIPLKRIAFDTGFDSDMLLKIFSRFEKDGKIIYKDNWVVILNFIKHQNTQSKTVISGINENLKNAPKWVLDTLSIRYPYGIIYLDFNLDLNYNLDSDLNENEQPKCKPKKNFIPPTLEQIKQYIAENNFTVNPDSFLRYYTVSNWIDAEGKQVKNWKLKLVSWQNREEKNPKQIKQKDTIDKIIDMYGTDI